MQRYNYAHSDYNYIKSGTPEDCRFGHENAAFMHHADMLKYRMSELEATGLLDDNTVMQALDALQRAQFSNSYVIVWVYISRMDRMLEQLPVYAAAPQSKTGRIVRFFSDLAA